MNLTTIVLTVLLLAPPIAIGAFWRAARRRGNRYSGRLPDAEALIMARVGALLCTVLPVLQLGASIIRYRTGEPGLYLWYLLPGLGMLLAVVALAALLTHARGRERKVSSAMILLSVSMLLLITLLGGQS